MAHAKQLDEVRHGSRFARPHPPVQDGQPAASFGESLERGQTVGILCHPLGSLGEEDHRAIGSVQKFRPVAPRVVRLNDHRLQAASVLKQLRDQADSRHVLV